MYRRPLIAVNDNMIERKNANYCNFETAMATANELRMLLATTTTLPVKTSESLHLTALAARQVLIVIGRKEQWTA